MSRGIFRVNIGWILVFFAIIVNTSVVNTYSCYEVKTAFQVRHIGPLKWVPETPATDVDLQICKHKGPTCCTRRMEESYLGAVRRETLQNIRSYSFELKYLLTSHAVSFQDTFQSLVLFSMNLIHSLFNGTYEPLAEEANAHVTVLFGDLAQFVLGGNISLESAVLDFYHRLFPVVFTRLLSPDGATSTAELSDCLRAAQQDFSPFGSHARALVEGRLERALRAARALLRALTVGAEVLNATERAMLSRDCSRALVRMQYCPHCRGLTLIRPCKGHCLSVMRGCLAGISQLDGSWKQYHAVLKDLGDVMAGAHDLELALLGIRSNVHSAIHDAQQNGPNISAMVERVCGQPPGTAASVHPSPGTASSVHPSPVTASSVHPSPGTAASVHPSPGTASRVHPSPGTASSMHPSPGTMNPEVNSVPSSEPSSSVRSSSAPPSSAPPSQTPAGSPLGQLAHLRSSLPLKPSKNDKPRSMKKICREFIGFLLHYKSFFSTLPETMCDAESAMEDSTCWSGDDVVESYTGRVTGNSLQAQKQDLDPMLTEVKEKLDVLIEEIRGGFPGLGTRSAWVEMGSGRTEGSSDCDDEDGCHSSGDGLVKIINSDNADGSKEGVPEKKEVEPPRRTPTVRPPKEDPKAAGSTPVASLVLLTAALLLFPPELQWDLL